MTENLYDYSHGGDIYGNDILYDFSVNTNPLGMPDNVKKKLLEGIDLYQNYPDLKCHELTEAISKNQDISYDKILCGNGASEIFKLIADAVRPKKALITAPSFSGYEYVLRSVGTKIEYIYLNEDEDFEINDNILDRLNPGYELIFLCSPCNPTGRHIDKDILINVLKYCEKNGIYLIVDECFLGFMEEYKTLSMVSETKSRYLIVVNAFTKLYAMAGLRLGFCVCGNKDLLKQMKLQQAEWSVSVPAQLAGVYALENENYISESRKLIASERKKMSGWLVSKGIKVFPSDVNFILIKSEIDLYRKLLERRILIRSCANYRGLSEDFYRIAIRTKQENRVLRESIEREV